MLYCLERFEQVHLSSELVGVAEAAIQVDYERIGRRKLAGVALAVPQEVDFGKRLAAPVEPGVEPPMQRRRWRVGRGHDQSIRLHTIVDLRAIPSHHDSGLGGPRRGAFQQRFGSRLAVAQQFLRFPHFVGFEELVVGQRVVDRALVDFYIRQ